MPLRAIRIGRVTKGKLKRGVAGQVMDDARIDDDVRKQINESAMEDLGMLVALLQLNYGLVPHLGRNVPEFAYHWHEPDGTCHADEAHDGFENISEAIIAGFDELLLLQRLHAMTPLIVALKIVGIDLTEVAKAIEEHEDEGHKIKEFARALRAALRLMVDSQRDQPGLNMPVIAHILGISREIVHHVGAAAHAAIDANLMPIPGSLPAGCVAIPAEAVTELDRLFAMIDTNEGPPNDDSQPHITHTA